MATTIRENRGWLKPHQPQFMNSRTLFNSRLKMIVRPSLCLAKTFSSHRTWTFTYIHTYVCMYTYTYTYIHIYIHVHIHRRLVAILTQSCDIFGHSVTQLYLYGICNFEGYSKLP